MNIKSTIVLPVFSVIIPIHNAEKYLNESINSIVNQTFKGWELVLIDDGSTDSSFQIASNLMQKDERIKLLQHPRGKNKGVSASRNLGMKHAKGAWVAFLDADDVWFPEKLQKQYDTIKQNEDKNLVLVYCLANVIDEKSKPINEKSNIKHYNSMFGIYGAGRPGLQTNAFSWAINKGFEAPTSSVVCRKEIILQLGGFEEDMSYSEDGLMWFRMIENGNMYYINTPLMAYRVHSSQWNASVTNQLKLARRFIGYERLLSYASSEFKSTVSYLLVNKGFRIVVRNNIGSPYFNLKVIGKYWSGLLKNKEIFKRHKFLSIFVAISEILILPLRLLKGSISKK